jgi:hypothetical protein
MYQRGARGFGGMVLGYTIHRPVAADQMIPPNAFPEIYPPLRDTVWRPGSTRTILCNDFVLPSTIRSRPADMQGEENKMSISGRVAKLVLIGIAGVLLMAPGGCPPPAPPPPLNAQTLVPTDPCTTNACVPVSPIAGATDVCPVSSSTFNTWFKPIPPATTGVVTLNGVVNPANSVSFNNIPNCAFYQWAMQDFLWLTSPAPPEYGGGGGLIVDSPTF